MTIDCFDEGESCVIGGGALLIFVIDQIFGYRASSPTFMPRGRLNVDRSRAWEDFYDELVRSLGSGHPIRSGDVEGALIIAQR